MEVRRTVPVKLDLSDGDGDLLRATIDEFRFAANYVVEHCRDDPDDLVITSKRKLHDRTYQEVRDRTQLHANLVQAARSRAADALKAVIGKWKRGKKASLPTFTTPFLEYDKRSASFHDDHASLSTVNGWVRADYVLPSDPEGTPHGDYLLNDDYTTTGATLHYRPVEGEWYLHVRTTADVETDADHDTTENVSVLGVDLGVTNLAVTSTGQFWLGDEINHWHREFEKRRASMQQRGTRYAHEAIQRVGRRETNFFKHYLHCVSKELVAEAVRYDCDAIAFENLTDIRDRMPKAKKFHAWAFRRLFSYVEYKAEAERLTVRQVNPRYTSQRCSQAGCGFTTRSNRPSQERFECQSCGYRCHADYNAAKNVAWKYVDLRSSHTSSDGAGSIAIRINTGTLSESGFEPAPPAFNAGSVRSGVHGENLGFRPR